MINLKVEDIINNYTIDLYDSKENPDGYQRPIQVSHRRKLVEYLTTSENPILNTSIVAAINYNCIKEENNQLIINSKMKIVDGQHRIEAFKELKEKEFSLYISKYNEYYIPIIIIPSEEDKILEIETFININNKNKKISTALAVQILQRIREKRNPDIFGDVDIENMERGKKEELVKSISNNVTCLLNDDSECLWFQLIKTGDSNTKNRVISINAFSDSLNKVVMNYIYWIKEGKVNTELLEIEIKNLILAIWDIIRSKWGEAFDIKYYNIQKGIGVYSMHSILATCIEESSNKALEAFKKIIEKSTINYNDWMIGGRFSSLNSKAGIKQIETFIKE